MTTSKIIICFKHICFVICYINNKKTNYGYFITQGNTVAKILNVSQKDALIHWSALHTA